MRTRLTEKCDRAKTAASGSMRREISDDFKYDKKKLKHIKHVLHNVNVALGTLVSALNEFSRIKGPDISPDGLLGGLGYIMSIRDMKEVFNTAIKGLSDVSDSLADELSNPKWNAEDDKDVKELIKEKEKVEDKVEEQAEEQAEEQESQDEDLIPDDVVTSNELIKTAAEMNLKAAVEKALISTNTKKRS